MLKKSRYFNKSKVLSILLICITILQLFITSLDTNTIVFADGESANDRVMNSINLSKGKSFKDIDTTKITEDDIQVLGVFLSNFYQPWYSEAISTSDDDAIKKRQTDALVSTCGFDEDVAKFLVEVVWQKSVSSVQPLYLGRFPTKNEVKKGKAELADGDIVQVSSTSEVIDECAVQKISSGTPAVSKNVYYGDYNGHTDNIFNDNGHTKATYFSFLQWFSGLKTDIGNGAVLLNKHFSSLNAKVCLFWMNGDKKIPVFDTKYGKTANGKLDKNMMTFTQCMAIYSLIMDELSYDKGIGSSMLDCTLDQYDSLASSKDKAVVMNSDLYVDCFGNILVDTGFQKFVMFPACANPYSWATKQDLSNVGKNINTVNLFCLGESESGNLTGEKSSSNTNNSKGLKYKFKLYTDTGSLFNLQKWRIRRGENDIKLDIHWFPGLLGKGEKDNEIRNELVDYFDIYNSDYGTQKYNFPNFGAYMSIVSLNGYKNKDGFTVNSTNLITDFIQIDNLNAWKTSTDDYSIFNTYDGGIFALDSDGKTCKSLASAKSKFTTTLNPGELYVPKGIEAQKYLTGIFVSYVLAYFNDGSGKYVVDYFYAKNQFPKIDTSQIDFSDIQMEVSQEKMQMELQSMLYYLAHPIQGVAYVANWFKTKVGGILVSWHEDMAGNSGAANTTGSTKYLGFSGYVTLPTLSDIKWTAWILNNYNNFVVYLILMIFIILLAYCIVGQMTFQRAIVGTIVFGFLAFLPPLAINATSNFINSTCDKVYGDKFTYWAIVQHATYLSDLDTALKENQNKDGYLQFLFSKQDGLDSDNYAHVKVKWLSPKKMRTTADDAEEVLNGITENKGLVLGSITHNLVNRQTLGEEYVDNSKALYLYRDYADIYMYSTTAYNSSDWYDDNKLKVSDKDLSEIANITNKVGYSNNDITIYDILSKDDILSADNYPYSSPFWYKQGFCINTGSNNFESDNHYSNKHYNFLLDSNAFSSIAYANNKLLSEDGLSDIVLSSKTDIKQNSFGLANKSFKLGLTQIKEGVSDFNPIGSNNAWSSGVGPFYFSLYSESPFYFFTWNILDQELSTEFGEIYNKADKNKGLLDIYTTNNQSYFYNYSDYAGNGYGEMRDFCDMHGLFYYVIPYLRDCNKGILEWSKLYGTYLYEDVSVKYNSDGTVENMPDINKKGSKGYEYSDEYIYKWWHNYNVERLFNTYTAWVDLMYACDYSKPQKISILGEDYIVNDPLDPTSYFTVNEMGEIDSGRPMIFSRSEMGYYGLTESDLTTVELKILNVQDEVYSDLLQLMDYYELGDKIDMNEVLTTAAGMLTTFAFNQEFSQTKPVGESFTLYPQSYELKAFSYDAYLRLIMSGSTNEDLLNTDNAMTTSETNDATSSSGKKSFYQRIVEKSSITTGILFIILDVIAIYMIPVLKMFFLVALFLMSVLMIISAAIRLNEEDNLFRTVWDALLEPLLKFTLVTVCLALIVSVFMSDGNTSVTGRGGFVVSLGDPAMVLIAMILINGVALILYYNICKKTFKKLVSFLKAIGVSVGGAIAGSVGKVFGAIGTSKLISDSVARGTAKSRGGMNIPHPHIINKSSENGGSSASNNSNEGSGSSGGTGNSSDGIEHIGSNTLAAPKPLNNSPINEEKEEVKRRHYDNLSKEQDENVDSYDTKADRDKVIASTLNGDKLREKSKSYDKKRDENKAKNSANIERLKNKESSGEKLTLSERSYLKRVELSDKVLATKSRGASKIADKMSSTNKRLVLEFNSREELGRSTARNLETYYRTSNTSSQVKNQRATQNGASRREVSRAEKSKGRANNAYNSSKNRSSRRKSSAKPRNVKLSK